MLGSTTLDVVLGLLFVYFALSLVCSKVNEYVASKLEWRAEGLEKGVRKLLTGSDTTDGAGAASPLARLVDLTHPLLDALKPPSSWRNHQRRASYLPADVFAVALLDALAPDGPEAAAEGAPSRPARIAAGIASLPDDLPAKQALLAFEKEAAGDLAVLRGRVEGWFDAAMDRVSGWYKRRVQLWLVLYAVVLAVALNVDSLSITRALYSNGPVRQAVVAAAGRGQASELDSVADGVAKVRNLELPITWAGRGAPASDPRRPPRDLGGWTLKLLGLALTVVALSLGAPFWFDLLNKVARLRATGDAPHRPA